MLYDYYCEQCQKTVEIRHSIKSEEIYKCEKCGKEMHKKISTEFHVASCNLKPTLADVKENNYKKKTGDKERAYRSRKRAFGEEPKIRDAPDPKKVIRGRTLGGQEKTIDKNEFVKACSKDNYCVAKALEVLKKQKNK